MRSEKFLSLPRDDQKRIFLPELREIKSKASWSHVFGSGHIDIILDDCRPNDWCSDYRMHVDAEEAEFDGFIDGVLTDPAQDLMALIQRIRTDSAPRPTNES